jgi:hypothetical protein
MNINWDKIAGILLITLSLVCNVMSDKMIRNIQLISAATTVVLGVIQIANYYKESKKREKIES